MRAKAAAMSKHWKPRKQTVELTSGATPPSRIRRDPARARPAEGMSHIAWWQSQEWEIRLALIGIVLFALGINAVVFDIAEFISQ
jgi:hypothetical protein